jgi:hypothetical protein
VHHSTSIVAPGLISVPFKHELHRALPCAGLSSFFLCSPPTARAWGAYRAAAQRQGRPPIHAVGRTVSRSLAAVSPSLFLSLIAAHHPSPTSLKKTFRPSNCSLFARAIFLARTCPPSPSSTRKCATRTAHCDGAPRASPPRCAAQSKLCTRATRPRRR